MIFPKKIQCRHGRKSMKYERIVICISFATMFWLSLGSATPLLGILLPISHLGQSNPRWIAQRIFHGIWAAARFTIMGCCCLLCTHFHGESRRVVGDPSHFQRRCVESSYVIHMSWQTGADGLGFLVIPKSFCFLPPLASLFHLQRSCGAKWSSCDHISWWDSVVQDVQWSMEKDTCFYWTTYLHEGKRQRRCRWRKIQVLCRWGWYIHTKYTLADQDQLGAVWHFNLLQAVVCFLNAFVQHWGSTCLPPIPETARIWSGHMI